MSSPERSPAPNLASSRGTRGVYVVLGGLCVALGVLGAFLPGLPVTPFALAASWFFARSSPRLAAWLDGHRWLGPYLRAVRGREGMPFRAKAATVAVLWAGLGASVLAFGGPAEAPLAASGLGAVGVGVTWFVARRIPTQRDGGPRDGAALPSGPEGRSGRTG